LAYFQGGSRYDGVNAFARGLTHINLGWAIIGCFIQFPFVSQILQLIADAGMFGKTLQIEVPLKNAPQDNAESSA
ncbi:MAG: hypothetical protein AAGC73_03970, partial [Verrucomicrobiota bacterium]